MKGKYFGAGLVALATWSSAQALVIDEATFRYYGGDTATVTESIDTRSNKLREFSYETAWLAVGTVGACTATWLGDKGGWTYVLTAAHCVDHEGTRTAANRTFTDWKGRVIASGAGTAHVPPQRMIQPRSHGGASTDIALLVLPTRNPMIDAKGNPIERPILNDALDEPGRDVIFVSHGVWGVGTNISRSFGSSTSARRLYGRSRVEGIYGSDHALAATFDPVGPSPSWARTAATDNGSAWWQIRGGKPVIIATTNGNSARASTGARVSKYVKWIQSIYSDVRVLSAERPLGCIVSRKTGARYCLPAGERSGIWLPSWIYAHEVFVDAAPGTAVMLSDWDNLSYGRLATFIGTVEHEQLKGVKAYNGLTLDFSKPRSMRVQSDSTPVSCIVSMTSSAKYCLPAGHRSGVSLPSWIYRHEVLVDAAPGTAVMLSDWDNLSYSRLATFPGLVQNWELKSKRAWNGETLDFSRPRSMRVVQE